MSPSAQAAASKLPSTNGSSSASARSKPALSAPRSAATRRAASTIAPEMSVPMTAPLRPTASAIRRLTSPVPQATSSTRSPGCRASMSSIREWAGSSWSRQPSS
jgi:hypothetical protein